MAECLLCKNGHPEYVFQVIEIQTLHIRDVSGEKYVQAMGEDKEYAVCAGCTGGYLAELLHPAASMIRKLLPFGILIVLGAAATGFLHSEELFIRLLGPIAILCGLIGIGVSWKEQMRQQQKMKGLEREAAMEQAAWQLFLAKAPKKNGDQDLTYVPVNPETKKMNKKELCLTYDLLPAIADQVSKKIKYLMI